jgi:hypothetical protein
LREVAGKSPQSQFWNDPAMKPFRDKFMAKWAEEFVQPLERDLGVKFDDYSALLQGQVTLAVTQEGWQGNEKDDGEPAVLFLLDAKDKSSLLKTNLMMLRKKWSAAGKPIKTEKIRDVEFSVVPLTTNDIPATLRKFFPQPQDVEELGKENQPHATNELIVGQYDSLLIVSSSLKAVEKVVIRIASGAAPTLAEQGDFESCRGTVFRDAPFYGWLNARTLIDVAVKTMAASQQNPEAPSPMPMPDVSKILAATGLNGLKAAAFSFRDSGTGRLVEFFLNAPEASRSGLLNLLAIETKEANPPAFVPADVSKFSRWRLDGPKAIATIEKVVEEFASSTWNYILGNANEAMRIDDPEFDIRKNIFANLGDDLISFEKAPRGKTLTELANAPALFLLGSPNADKLAASLRGLFVIISPQGGSPASREFLGRKIYSFKLPGRMAGNATALNYVASGGYVAFSTDDAILEEYLRSSDGQTKALRDSAGFAEAVAKVNGPGIGWLSYENQSESVRLMMDLLSRSAASTNKNELGSVLASAIPFAPPEKTLKEWVDFSLLPSFDKVAKYFGFGIAGGSTSVNGISIKYYSPTPAELLKK